MLTLTTTDLPSTLEADVRVVLHTERTARVTKERLNHEGGVNPTAQRLRREIAAELIASDLAEEWDATVGGLVQDMRMVERELATVKADRDRLARVVDKLTAVGA